MAVPTLITELSTTAASNPPSGSESTAEGDNNLRAAYAFIAQLHSEKAPKASPTFTGTVVLPSTTSIGNVSSTEIGYLDNVTSAIQTQLNAKAALASPTFTGVVTVAAGSVSAPSVAFTGDSNTGIWSPGADTVAVSTGGSERMRVDGSGFIGINGNGGTEFLTVFGNSQTTAIPMCVNDQRSADGVNSAAMTVKRGGSIVGSITTTNAATFYNTSSDYRLKNISGDLQGSGSFIDALQPRVGTWKVDGSPFVGFVAHELQAVSPLSVTGEKDGEQMQSVAYGSAELIANMVAELKALRARVAALES